MAKIAIMTCDNIKNECNCAGMGCLRSLYNKTEMFERYKGEEIELVGLSTCDGCPTIYAHEKILKKIKPLVELSQAEKIHFSSCMVRICPFVQKYKKVINETYPEVEVLFGTDATPEQPMEAMLKALKNLLTDPSNNDITVEFTKIIESAEHK